jgi:hypothetical protein
MRRAALLWRGVALVAGRAAVYLDHRRNQAMGNGSA